MKRLVVSLLLAATPVACGRSEPPPATDDLEIPTPTDRDGWLAALTATADHAQLAALAGRYLASVPAPTAAAWASQLHDDRLTLDGMRAQRADALHARGDFTAAAADYEQLLASPHPFVSRGRLLYRLAFARARATLDDRILDHPGQLARLVLALRQIDGQVAASDEFREHIDYMLVVLEHLNGTPDLPRTLALAEAVRDDADPATRGSRLTLLDLGERAAVASGQPARAAALRQRRAAITSTRPLDTP